MEGAKNDQGWKIPTIEDWDDIFDYMNDRGFIQEGWIIYNDKIEYILCFGMIRGTTIFPVSGTYKYL